MRKTALALLALLSACVSAPAYRAPNVQLAPAFGADDYAAGKKYGLAFLQPVNGRGEFPEDVPVVGGLFVKKADPLLIEELKRRPTTPPR